MQVKIIRKPIVMVRRVGEHFEYYIQQGRQRLNFFLLPDVHEDLKIAQRLAEQAPQKPSGEHVVVALEVVPVDQKSLAG